MISFFVKRPVTTLMFVLFFVLLGIVAYPEMNVERTPAIDFPMVSVQLTYPGASPREVEELAVRRVEDAVSEISEIQRVTSESFENGGFILVEFNIGVDVNAKLNEVKASVEAILNDLPTEMQKPQIEKLNPLQESVMDVIVRSDRMSGRDLYLYADQVLRRKLTALRGVASVNIFGGQERAIRIFLDPAVMSQRFVTITDISNAMRRHNINFPGGRIERESDSITIRFVGEFRSVEDIKNMPVITSEGQRFVLRDIAVVEDAARRVERGSIYNNEDVVMLSIVKASDGNAVRISRAFYRALPGIESLLPEGMTLSVVSDVSVSILNETRSTWGGIFIGLALTMLILLVFTGNGWTTLIASVVIPSSLLAGFFFMNQNGFTINSMTLLAMATALGTLITNAIIIIESSLVMLDRGMEPQEAAIEGTKRVSVAILAATLTNVVVFLPIAFMSGVIGQFMKQFGMSVVYLTGISLLFSISLTPMMIGVFFKSKEADQKKTEKVLAGLLARLAAWSDGIMHAVLDTYEGVYKFIFRHPLFMIIICLAVLWGSFGFLRYVGSEFVTSTDTNEIRLVVKAPQGAIYARTAEIARDIEGRLRAFPEVEAVSAQIGERGVENISMQAFLVPFAQRVRTDKELIQAFIPALADVVDAEIQIAPGSSAGMNIGDMVINVFGEDEARIEAYAERMAQLLNQIPEIQSATVTARRPRSEFRFIPNLDMMNFYAVSNQNVATTIRFALFGDDSQNYKDDGVEFPIIIELGDRFKDTKDVFSKIYVNSPKGLVPISLLGTLEESPGSPVIRRRDRQRISEVAIILGKSTIGPVRQEIYDLLDKEMTFENGYGFYFAGMSETQDESTAEIVKAFLLATILIYMVLAAILDSLIHPFTIATSVLTSFAGVFFMLFLTGTTINIASMLAVVMLVGLVVTNSILLLEPTIALLAQGRGLQESLWAMFREKYRMIMMTTIAVISGILPQLWSIDRAKASMGAVIIGGMLGSLVFIFFLTPALFMYFERLSRWLRR